MSTPFLRKLNNFSFADFLCFREPLATVQSLSSCWQIISLWRKSHCTHIGKLQQFFFFFTVALFLCSLPNDRVKKIKKKPSLSDPCPFIWSSQILPKQAAGYPKTLILLPTVNLVSSPDQVYNDLVLSKYRIITPLSLSHFSCPSPGCPSCPNPTTGPKEKPFPERKQWHMTN